MPMVKLNVGGRMFRTSESTLRACGDFCARLLFGIRVDFCGTRNFLPRNFPRPANAPFDRNVVTATACTLRGERTAWQSALDLLSRLDGEIPVDRDEASVSRHAATQPESPASLRGRSPLLGQGPGPLRLGAAFCAHRLPGTTKPEFAPCPVASWKVRSRRTCRVP